MSNLSLFELTKEQLEISEFIESSQEIDGVEMDEIDQAVLQISNDQFVEKSSNYLSIITHFNGEVARFKELKAQVDVAIKRKERVIENLKRNLTEAIKILGPKEIGIYKLSIRKNPGSVVIEDSALLTDEYLSKKMVITPDKTKIGQDLKKGVSVPGASLLIVDTLTIR